MKNNKHYNSHSTDYCEYDNENYLRRQQDRNKNKRIKKNNYCVINKHKSNQKKRNKCYNNGDDED